MPLVSLLPQYLLAPQYSLPAARTSPPPYTSPRVAPPPLLITRDHILAALREIDVRRPELPRSLGYDLVYCGHHYPPVAVMRIAHRLATGIEDWPLPGGVLTNRVLEDAGFTVVSKKKLALLRNPPHDADPTTTLLPGAGQEGPTMPEKQPFVPPVRGSSVAEPAAPDETSSRVEEPAGGYDLETAANGLFLDPGRLAGLLDLLRARKVLVLQGPPGTGKSLVARRLAGLLHGSRAVDRTVQLQLHSGYAYDDFILGYRPTPGGGFALREGVLTQLALRAQADPAHPYVLLLDELNRAPLAAVLGEALTLLPAEARGPAFGVRLPAAPPEAKPLWLPDNLFLIATLNPADRALAPLDLALRRRLAFATLAPEFGPRFRSWLIDQGAPTSWGARLADALIALNEALTSDPALGPGFQIGHSYFTTPPPVGTGWPPWLARLLDHDLEPLLADLFPEDPASPARLLRPLRELTHT